MSDPLTPGEPPVQNPLPPTAAAAPGLKPGWERETMERLLFATLAEQRRARRWRTFTRLAWLLFFAALFWAAFYRGTPKADKSKKSAE
ncbi:MAG: hypothetical protein EOO24_48460 [Comamonadaceae bacterium]|nr:MAG: hypothetical protein EOO24_48460 [Comamonadaceae bacterium]